MSAPSPLWIVCQIGAREHYAIPRALHQQADLAALITDFWVEPGSPVGKIPGGRRLKDRYHLDLAAAEVIAPNLRMLAFETQQRVTRKSGWDAIIARNALFQALALRHLRRWESRTARRSVPTLFSYSYAALEPFRFAKKQGWKTVLGQIDAGPQEERIVEAEQKQYAHLKSSWQPAPSEYWQNWREEIALADRIIINSEWSRQCMIKEGVSEQKMEVIPLVYGAAGSVQSPESRVQSPEYRAKHEARSTKNEERNLQVLFLGQINLRKGIGRLLDAMRLLKDEAVELTLSGPAEIDPEAWADLPKVKWVGPVPRSDVGRYYDSADLFILPTLSDGYAMTQLEALSRGLPVMASKRCGEAVRDGENGWLLENLEPEAIAQALLAARAARPLPAGKSPQFGIEDLARELGTGR